MRFSEIKAALMEQPWNNQSDTGSLSSKIFQPGDFIANDGDPIWGLWLPLSSSILHRITPKKQRVTAFHLTGVQNIDNMINLQGKKKSISSFFYMHHSHYDRGVRGGGGVIFELDANLLGAFEQDIMSDPDKSGIRWITLEYLVRAAYEHGEPLAKLYGEMAGLLKTLLKKYAPDVTYDSDIDAGDKWKEFGKSLATAKDGKTQNLVIKDYIDGTYSIMLKHAEHVQKALFYYMDNPGSTNDDWDEVVVNEFKIKTAHVLKNTVENPQNLEKLKQLESKGIPVRVWDSPQELNDYVEKIGMSQKLDENLQERKSADLYHSTHDDESFASILKSGAIKPNFDHQHTTEKDPRPYISLSRDKRFDMFGSLPITLVIDQTKLSNSHKITPYDSFAGDDDFDKRSSGSSEAEERVYKPIPISYIKYVILRNANWIDSEAVLAAAKAANIPVVDLNGQLIKENFADGKKKGKSRPGRVKRAGASCNGSVTDLRKRAKKYSGERGRMYHWCANMKSGRKKK